jgi:Na+-driven multidrug efflux pump
MLASVSLTLSRIPLSVWAGTRFGIEGLWWVISATAAARGVAMMALWRWGRWKRNLV